MTKERNELTVRSDAFVFHPLAYLLSPIEWIEQSENRSTGYLIGRFISMHMISSPQGLKIHLALYHRPNRVDIASRKLLSHV